MMKDDSKAAQEIANKGGNIPISQFGRDHWNTFAYLETRIVDHRGVIKLEHMRVDPVLHPHFAHEYSRMFSPAPTRLASGEVSSHDDWSCLDDAEAEGLIQNVGSGMNRRYVFTDKGRQIATALREYITRNNTTLGFDPSVTYLTNM
jgi:hypothetical protein